MATTKDFEVKVADFTTEGLEVTANKQNTIKFTDLAPEHFEYLSFKYEGYKLIVDFTFNNTKLIVSNLPAIKYAKDKDNNRTDLIGEDLVYNWNPVEYNSKKKAYVGTVYNDYFESTTAAEKFIGGIGKNTFYYSKAKGGHDVIELTNKENLILDLSSDINKNDIVLKYANKNKDLVLYIDENNSITLKNYASKNVVGTGSILLKTTDCPDGALIDSQYITTTITDASNYTGTRLNDDIYAVGAQEKLKKGKHVDLVFKGGAGDDFIESSMFADQLTGGTGDNVYEYTSFEQMEGDKIYLTKGENAEINVSSIVGAVATYKVVGKNLEVTVSDGDKEATFTIMNLGTKDVTNNATKKNPIDTSSVVLFDSTGGYELRTGVRVASDVGTYHNDDIDRGDYYNKKGKGLTLNGGAGNDKITGTDYADTIKAGTGDFNELTGGKGNDKLYSTTTKDSETAFIFNKGDGADTIYNATKEDIIKINDVGKDELRYVQNANDLEIFYRDNYNTNDMIVVKDYYKVDGKDKINKLEDKNGDVVDLSTVDRIIAKSGKINADSDGDILVGSAKADTIKAETYNGVVIAGEKGNDKLSASTMPDSNTTFKFNLGDGKDTVYSGNGDDTLDFDELSVSNLDFSKGKGKSADDLIIKYSAKDSVTIKDFYKATNTIKHIKVKEGTFDIASIKFGSGEIDGTDDADTLFGSAGQDTIKAKAGDDIICAKGGKDTIYAGAGNDKIFGGAGNDEIHVGAGYNNIYHTAGDGNDSVILDDGVGANSTKFYFKDVDSVDKLNGAYDVNDLVITRENGEKITINDFKTKWNSNNVSVAIGKSETLKNITEVKNHINSAEKIVNGTAWHDDIYTTFKNQEADYATVNAGAGNDVIHITNDSDYPEVYLGTGNDTVSLETTGTNTADVGIHFEKGDGNNTLAGLTSSLAADSQIVLYSDDLLRTIDLGDKMDAYQCLVGSAPGGSKYLVLNQIGGETFTINNYLLAGSAKDMILINSNGGENVNKITEYDIVAPDDFVEITGDEAEYTVEGSGKTIFANDTDTARTINISNDNNYLYARGSNAQTVNINIAADASTTNHSEVYLYNTGDASDVTNVNTINISNKGTGNPSGSYLYVSGGYRTNLDLGFNIDEAVIEIYDGHGGTISTSGGASALTDLVVSTTSDADRFTIRSKGSDSLDLRKGTFDVNIINNNKHQNLWLHSGTKSVDVHDAIKTASMNIDQELASVTTAKDVMFEYTQGIKTGEIEYGILNLNYVDSFGKVLNTDKNWVSFNGTGIIADGDFDLDASFANKVQVDLYKATNPSRSLITSKKLNQMTQYVGMGYDELYKVAENVHQINFNDPTQSCLLDYRAGAFIAGTNKQDIYNGYTFTNGIVTIDDADGNNDELHLGMNRDDYRFFIDFNNAGQTQSSDLLIFKHTGGKASDVLWKFLGGNGQGGDLSKLDSYVQINDGFDDACSWSSMADGCIETIGDNENTNFDVDTYVDSISAAVGGWLDSYNTNHHTAFSSVTAALKDGQATEGEIETLYFMYCDNDHWATY